MASSYGNDLRLNEMATGDASGTWGTVTNTNLELIGEALGFGTEAITTNADTHTSTVADGATDPVRAMFVKYTGTLDSSCTITIAPNDMKRMQFIENGTSGGQNIIISQGSGANVTIPPGDTKAVYLNGAGSGAAVIDAFASLSVVDLKVQDDLTFTSDSAVITFGSDNDTTLTHTDGSGLTLNGTNKLMFNDASQFIQGASATVLDIAATDTIELTATNIAVVGTMGATGKITADAGIDIDNINIDGTTIALSSGDLTLDVAGDIILDADGKDYLFKDAGTLIATMSSDNTDFTIRSEVSNRDLKFEGNDNGANVTALILDMSDAGSATFSHNVKLPDNGVLALGAGSDLSLSSNGTNGTIAAPNGILTIDCADDIKLDAAGGDIKFLSAGTEFGEFRNISNDLVLISSVNDKDIVFKGQDNGSEITALTLDMSNSGNAIFNNDIDQPNTNSFIKGAGHNIIQTDANTTYFYGGVNGVQFRTADNAAENITFSNAGAAVFNEQGNDADFRVETDGNANTLFIEGSSNNMSIGHSPPTFASGNGVHLADFYFIGFGNGNGTRPDFQLGQDTSTNTLAFRCGTGADTIDLSINTSGVFSGDFNDTSDERLKENIQDIADNQINIVKQLRPVTFDWKEDGKGADTGFIAQEVVKLLPNDVHTSTGLDDDSQLGINSLGLIATLTKALQEAITKIETLEAKVTTMENA